MPLRVLVVDDEKITRRATVEQLHEAGYVAEAAENAYLALQLLDQHPWDVVVTDLRMPGMSGLEFLGESKRRVPFVEVIVVTAYGTVETAMAAMRQGAADYLTKPFSFAELEVRLERMAQLKQARDELSRLRAIVQENQASRGIVGRSPAMSRVRERIELFAGSVAPVLVTGETGTGKELVARAIHQAGPRRGRSFIPVACGAISRELAESELLGHEKGAFTGAISRHPGCFEQASGGSLLLDDVDDLPLETQVKLLRVLQEGTIRRVGGHEEIAVDVRVIATSKIDLESAAAAGRFRQDLLYRLRGLEIRLPPLRERDDDVLLLAQRFLEVLAAKCRQPVKTLSPAVAAIMRRYAWPGNVRELWRVVESSVALCAGEEIRAEHLPEFLAADRGAARPYLLHLDHVGTLQLASIVEQFEDDLVQWALRQANGQQARAAEILGIPRTTLQSKLARRKGD